MGQGSAGFFEDDEDDADALPMAAQDRASQNLRSPNFQLPREAEPEPVASVPEPRVVAEAPPLPAPPEPILHRRWSDPRREEVQQRYDQHLEQRQQREHDQALKQAGVESLQVDGTPVFKPTVGKPVQGEDGGWYRDLRDESGKTTRYSMDDARLAKAERMRVDPMTGDRYFEQDGLRVLAGKDEPTVTRLSLLSQRRALTAQDREERAQMAADRGALNGLKEQLKAFGSTPKQFETTIKNLTATGATDEATQNRLKLAQSAYTKWQADHPEYANARAQADLFEANISNREQAIVDRRLRAAALMGKPASAALAGSLPSTDPLPVVRDGDVDSRGFAAWSALQALQSGKRPAMAAADALVSLREQGARTIGGKPIEDEMARLAALAAEPPAATPATAFFRADDAISAIWDSLRGLGKTAPSAFFQMVEGLERPDRYSPAARKAFAEAAAYQQELQGKMDRNRARGESSSVGESVREAGGSLGFSGLSMGAAILGRLAGAPAGPVGAVGGSMLASGAAAYRMAGASFLNEAFQNLESEAQRTKGRPMTEQEKAQYYKVLLPIAQNTGLWEAGPEAVGNALTLGLGKVALGFGKPLVSKFANTAAGRVAAGLGAIGGELATETLTQVEQGADEKKAQAIVEGRDPNTIKADWNASGILRAFKEVAPQTLALMGMMGTAGAMVKGGQKLAQRWTTAETPASQSEEFQTAASKYSDAIAAADTALGNGDTAGHAQQMEAAQSALNDAALGSLKLRTAVSEDARKTLANLADPNGDFVGQEQALAQDPATGFAALEIGRALRDVYADPERDAKIQQVVTRMNVEPALATAIVDQHTAFAAARDLQAVLTGQPIDPARAQALEQLGLVDSETTPEGAARLSVTDDALPLLPPALRQSIAERPDEFAFTTTPGTPGALWSQFVRAGLRRLSDDLARNPVAAGADINSLLPEGAEMTGNLGEDVRAMVDGWVRKFGPLFDAVEQQDESRSSGGFSISADGRTFSIWWPDVAAEVNATIGRAGSSGATREEAHAQALKRVAAMLDEELRHVADVRANSDADTAALWKALPKTIQNATRAIYTREAGAVPSGALSASGSAGSPGTLNDVQWGREFKRMLSQGENGLSELADVTLRELQASNDTTLAGRILAHVRSMMEWLRGTDAAATEAMRQLQRLEAELAKITGEKPSSTVPTASATVTANERSGNTQGNEGGGLQNRDASGSAGVQRVVARDNAIPDGSTEGSAPATGRTAEPVASVPSPEESRPLSDRTDLDEAILSGFERIGGLEDAPETRALPLSEFTDNPEDTETIEEAIEAGLIDSFDGMLVPGEKVAQRISAAASAAQAEAEADILDNAKRDAGFTSLLDEVIRKGGINITSTTGNKLGQFYGEEGKRVAEALKVYNDRAKSAGRAGVFPPKLINKDGLTPDEWAHENFGGRYSDGNAFLAALENELATGKPEWVLPDQGGEQSDGERGIFAARSHDRDTRELDLEGLTAAQPRQRNMGAVWQRLTKKRSDGVKLTQAEEDAYLLAERELGQQFLVNLDEASEAGRRVLANAAEAVVKDPGDQTARSKLLAAGLLPGDVSEIGSGELKPADVVARMAKRKEQAANRSELEARAKQRLTGGEVADQFDMFSGRPEDKKGNKLLFAGARQASTQGDWGQQNILPMTMTPGGNAVGIDTTERTRLHRLAAIAFESAGDVLERQQNPMAHKLASGLREYSDLKAAVTGLIEARFEKALGGQKGKDLKQAKDQWKSYFMARENGQANLAASLRADLSPLARQLVQIWEKVAEETGRKARGLNIQVWDQELNNGAGGYRLIGFLGTKYFPRMMKRQVWEVIDNPDKRPKLRRQLEDALVAAGWDPAKARAFFELGAAQMFDRNDFFGALEMARRVQLPEEFYEYDFDKVVPGYIEAFSQRAAQIKVFGQKLTKLPPTDPRNSDLFDRTMKEAVNGATRDYIEAARKQVYGIHERGVGSRALSSLRVLASGMLLSNPFTTVPRNAISGIYSTAELLGAGRSLAALKNILKGTVPTLNMVQLGVVRGAMLDAAQYVDPELDVSGVIRKITGTALKVSGYNASEEFVRRHAAATAMVYVNDFLTQPMNSKMAQEAEAFMRRIGIDPAKVRAEKGDFAQGLETRRFLRQAVKEAQFGYDVAQVPLWGNSPLGRLFYQFGRWGMQRTRTLWKHVFEPAIFGDWQNVGGRRYRVRRFAPMARLLTTLPLRTAAVTGGAILTGEMFAAMAGMFFDRDRDDATLSEIARTADESRLKALGKLADRAMNDVMTGGMLGILSQPLDFYRAWFQGARFKNPLEPPVSAIPRALGELLLSLKERGMPINFDDFTAGQLRDVDTAVDTMLPGVAATETAVSNLAAKMGLHVNAIEAQEAIRQVRNLRKAARRYAKEEGLEAGTGGVFNRVAKTPHTATYDRVQNALLIGDFERARRAADEYLATVPAEDRMKAERSLKLSVKQREPIKVGPYHSAAVKQSFFDWSAKNLPPAQVREIELLQRTYSDSATMAGF